MAFMNGPFDGASLRNVVILRLTITQECAATDQPLLDPPPADPAGCHPARD